MSDRPPPSPWLPAAVLAGLLLVGLAAWQLFPVLQGFISRQDCVATGRTNC